MSKRKSYYQSFLNSSAWRSIRRKVLTRDGFSCSACGCSKPTLLRVHHKRYGKNLKAIPLKHLITLCDYCHRKEHKRLRRERKQRSEQRKVAGVRSNVVALLFSFSSEECVIHGS